MTKHTDGKKVSHTIRFNEVLYGKLQYYFSRKKGVGGISFNSMIEGILWDWVVVKEAEERLIKGESTGDFD
jgi:hypothetical protein